MLKKLIDKDDKKYKKDEKTIDLLSKLSAHEYCLDKMSITET